MPDAVAFTLTPAIQQQACHVVTNCEGASVDVFPDDLAQLIHGVIHAAARGESMTISRLPDVLTTTEAAHQLGISRPTLMKRIRDGEIESFKVGSHTRLKTSAVISYQRERLQIAQQAINDIRQLDEEIFET